MTRERTKLEEPAGQRNGRIWPIHFSPCLDLVFDPVLIWDFQPPVACVSEAGCVFGPKSHRERPFWSG